MNSMAARLTPILALLQISSWNTNVRTRPEQGITDSMLIVSDSNGAKSMTL